MFEMNPSDANAHDVKSAKEEMELIYEEKIKGIIRARARWHEHGERSTKYFLNIPRLTEEQKLSCEGKITPEECALLLGSFKENKSPGNDGLPINRKFWPVICGPFLKCANECFEKGEMSSKNKQLSRLLKKREKIAFF